MMRRKQRRLEATRQLQRRHLSGEEFSRGGTTDNK